MLEPVETSAIDVCTARLYNHDGEFECDLDRNHVGDHGAIRGGYIVRWADRTKVNINVRYERYP